MAMTLKNGLLRLNRFLGKASAIAGSPKESAEAATCRNCGAAIYRTRRCPSCNHPTNYLPGWALSGRDRRLVTRRRVIVSGAILAALLFIFWLNYPFLPNYRILIFHQPTTEASSNSTLGSWTMAGGDLAQRKLVPTGPGLDSLPSGTLKWSVPTGEGTRSGPIVADGKVYVGAYFRMLALDAETGEVAWSQSSSGPIQTSAALAGNRLYAGYLDHRLRALSLDTGEVLWEYRAGDIITGSPLVHDGILYFGSWDNRQYALDAATGEEIWLYEATEKIGSLSPVSDGIMAVADKGGRIHLLNARTGQNRLVFRTPKSTIAPPVIAHDHVYFSAGGRLYAIDALEKEVPGQYQFKRVWAQLWLWQVPGVPRPAGQQGGRWRFSPDGADSSIVASPAVSNTKVYVGDLNGRLYAVDPLSGKELWRFQAEGGVYASPVVAGNTVFIATQHGKVYAVDGSTGRELWKLELGTAVNEPMAFAGGTLYIRTADGAVHAVE